MTEEERIFSGRLFASEAPELVAKKRRAHRLSQEYNNLFEEDSEGRNRILGDLLEAVGEGTWMLGPIHFHYGCHTRIGAGSVVTRDVPANSFAAGVPAHVIRPITKADAIENLFDEIR